MSDFDWVRNDIQREHFRWVYGERAQKEIFDFLRASYRRYPPPVSPQPPISEPKKP